MKILPNFLPNFSKCYTNSAPRPQETPSFLIFWHCQRKSICRIVIIHPEHQSSLDPEAQLHYATLAGLWSGWIDKVTDSDSLFSSEHSHVSEAARNQGIEIQDHASEAVKKSRSQSLNSGVTSLLYTWQCLIWWLFYMKHCWYCSFLLSQGP